MTPAPAPGFLFWAAMKPLADFYSRLQPRLPGVSVPLMNQALLDSAVLFCQRSLALRADLEPIVTQVGVDEYHVDNFGQVQPYKVMGVRCDGEALHLTNGVYWVRPTTHRGRPHTASVDNLDGELVVTLDKLPDDAYQIVVSAAMAPSRTATALPDQFMTQWLDALILGALGALQKMRGQPFHDDMLAQRDDMRAHAETNRARTDALRGSITGSLRVAPRPFA